MPRDTNQPSVNMGATVELDDLEQRRDAPIQPPSPTNRKHTFLILLGCGILQLPTWGAH